MVDKSIAVIFGISSDMAFALANVLQGLKQHSIKLIKNVIVYHDGLSDADKKALLTIAPCRFEEYIPPFSADELSIAKEHLNAYTMNMFARYEGFRLLKEYDAVIWFDVDIIIMRDVTELLNLVYKGGEGIGMCLENRDWFKLGDNFVRPFPGYDMGSPTFNSGLLVLTRDLKNADEIHKWLYMATVKYADYLRWPDQAILNLMLKEFHLIPAALDSNVFNRHPNVDHDSGAAIIHAFGPNKFWNYPDWFTKYPQWQQNHKKWSRIRRAFHLSQTRPIVSVVIPMYNCRQFVFHALNSIVEQTFFDIEIIVVNDGSSDGSAEIVKKLKDSRIRIIDNAGNLGISQSLNRGIREARGDYIARMDADDYAMPFRLAAQLKYFSNNPYVSLCATSVEAFGETSWTSHNVDDSSLLQCSLFVANPFVHPSVMWRKDEFERHDLWYDPNYDGNEDFELWQRAAKHLKFGFLDTTLLMYRIHSGSVTGSKHAGKTRKLQISLIDRMFSELGVSFSHDALLLLDSRDNTYLLSRLGIRKAFSEICRSFLRVAAQQNRYNKQKLALILLRHLNWIYVERISRFTMCASLRRYASVVLMIRAGAFMDSVIRYLVATSTSQTRFAKMRYYLSVFLTSPTLFMKKAYRKIFSQ